MRCAKIVATMGPATSTPETLRALVDAGMDVARLNLSHGSHEVHAETPRGTATSFGSIVHAVADFVAKGEKFIALADQVLAQAVASQQRWQAATKHRRLQSQAKAAVQLLAICLTWPCLLN